MRTQNFRLGNRLLPQRWQLMIFTVLARSHDRGLPGVMTIDASLRGIRNRALVHGCCNDLLSHVMLQLLAILFDFVFHQNE